MKIPNSMLLKVIHPYHVCNTAWFIALECIESHDEFMFPGQLLTLLIDNVGSQIT